MAKRYVLVDDLTGKEIPDGEGGTVPFSYNGVNYTIDLHKVSAEKLEKALKPFTDVATVDEGYVAAPGARKRPRGTQAAKTDKAQLDAIREWARTKGYEVALRGRIKQTIIDEYNAQSK